MFDFLLIIVISGLITERYFYTKEVNERTNEYMRAIMSKNTSEYMSSMPVKPQSAPNEPDEVEVAELEDKEFMEHITQQTR